MCAVLADEKIEAECVRSDKKLSSVPVIRVSVVASVSASPTLLQI